MFRPRTLASLLALAAGACVRNPAFQLGGEAATTTGVVATTTGTTELVTEADLSSGTDTGTSSGGGTTTTGVALTSTSGTSDPDAPSSCGQAREQGMLTSGLQKIAVPGMPGQTIEVWCEQEIADGGWMLVGRSAPDGKATGFGWHRAFGQPQPADEPYSLDAVTLGLPMTQILVGVHAGDNRLGEHIYALTVDGDFLTAYPDAPAKVTTIFTVEGDCDPQGGSTMLHWAGYTELTDHFRLRDLENEDDGGYGLRADKLELNYDNCFQGADLDDQQGVLFVR